MYKNDTSHPFIIAERQRVYVSYRCRFPSNSTVTSEIIRFFHVDLCRWRHAVVVITPRLPILLHPHERINICRRHLHWIAVQYKTSVRSTFFSERRKHWNRKLHNTYRRREFKNNERHEMSTVKSKMCDHRIIENTLYRMNTDL